jgi:hypothetical protein
MKSMLATLCGLLSGALALAQPNFPAPKTFPPDEPTLQAIKEKTAELRTKLDGVRKTNKFSSIRDAEVCLKAAEWMVKHNDWFAAATAQQTLDVIRVGLARTQAIAEGKSPWLETRGKPIALAYRSRVDESVQPYSLLYPANYDPKKKYRLDIVLHGRDGTLSEVKFIHGKEFSKGGNPPDHFVLEAYGRGNNAYRWAGETDVLEALADAIRRTGGEGSPAESSIDDQKIVLRGFSMGGAGSWHIGLHFPTLFAVVGPGAGFTTTRGYIAKFGEQPDYIEKCLHIYDAVDYAENAFNVPIVAYSGEIDAQKKAADNIEAILKTFKEPHSFMHIIAPGLEHKQPPEWLKKCDEAYRKEMVKKQETPERVRFVTYTTQYDRAAWVEVAGLDQHYSKSLVDATWNKTGITVKTTNVRRLILNHQTQALPETVTIDGQAVKANDHHEALFEKVEGKWKPQPVEALAKLVEKKPGVQGPIDDAFRRSFVIVPSSAKGVNTSVVEATAARQKSFANLWNKWFRGEVYTVPAEKVLNLQVNENLVLFGDPASHPLIARVLPKLPIQWTKDQLVVNGETYDAKTHYPVLIYPNPENPQRYVVINSGHTFGEADLRGTNALLYPRLGDWAVLKLAPTKENPAAVEVVAAGLFNEQWQFPKKK